MLSDDVLLNTFCHYLDDTPQFWPTLVRVCRRWGQIVLNSPLGLRLRLYLTYGIPVLNTLDSWPALPINLRYGGFPNLDPPAPEDEDNITAALKLSDRINSISLTVTSPLLEKLSAIERPFTELEDLVLLSRDSEWLTLPSAFRWGPRLCTLHLTRIAVPALPQLLSHSTGLVDLQLHEIPNVGYFTPDALTNALSEITQLETLSLHFLSFPPRRDYLGLPSQSGKLVVLPALTCLRYRGTSTFLDRFVARIDAPRLSSIDITFFSQPTVDASQLGLFIERIEMQTSLSQASIQTSAHGISISFKEMESTSVPLQVQISSKQPDWQLSSMVQICDQFSPFLFRVKDLDIDTTQSSSGQDVDGEQWLRLIRAFGGAKHFHVAGVHVTDILCALRAADGGHTTDTTVLPALRNLRVEEPLTMHGPSWNAVQSFIALRSLSGRPVQVYAREYWCHICYAGFTEPKDLKIHPVNEHAYRTLCSHCGAFEWSPGSYDYIFRVHLNCKHPEITRNDALISNSFFTFSLPFQVGYLISRHSSLRAPDVVAPSTNHGAALSIAGDFDTVPSVPNDILSFFEESFAPSPLPTPLLKDAYGDSTP